MALKPKRLWWERRKAAQYMPWFIDLFAVLDSKVLCSTDDEDWRCAREQLWAIKHGLAEDTEESNWTPWWGPNLFSALPTFLKMGLAAIRMVDPNHDWLDWCAAREQLWAKWQRLA
jgi:hypothetical protein